MTSVRDCLISVHMISNTFSSLYSSYAGNISVAGLYNAPDLDTHYMPWSLDDSSLICSYCTAAKGEAEGGRRSFVGMFGNVSIGGVRGGPSASKKGRAIRYMS
jgi:hypothetical protein